MDYNWQIVMENYATSSQARSVTFAQEESRPMTAGPLVARSQTVRPSSAASSVVSDVAYTPFAIEPESGSILPGKKGNFTVKFSPLDVNEYDARLICRYELKNNFSTVLLSIINFSFVTYPYLFMCTLKTFEYPLPLQNKMAIHECSYIAVFPTWRAASRDQ